MTCRCAASIRNAIGTAPGILPVRVNDSPMPSPESFRIALNVQVVPLQGDVPAGGTFIVAWLNDGGDARNISNAIPNRRVLDLTAGDVLIFNGAKYRFLQAQVFRSGA